MESSPRLWGWSAAQDGQEEHPLPETGPLAGPRTAAQRFRNHSHESKLILYFLLS